MRRVRRWWGELVLSTDKMSSFIFSSISRGSDFSSSSSIPALDSL